MVQTSRNSPSGRRSTTTGWGVSSTTNVTKRTTRPRRIRSAAPRSN